MIKLKIISFKELKPKKRKKKKKRKITASLIKKATLNSALNQ